MPPMLQMRVAVRVIRPIEVGVEVSPSPKLGSMQSTSHHTKTKRQQRAARNGIPCTNLPNCLHEHGCPALSTHVTHTNPSQKPQTKVSVVPYAPTPNIISNESHTYAQSRSIPQENQSDSTANNDMTKLSKPGGNSTAQDQVCRSCRQPRLPTIHRPGVGEQPGCRPSGRQVPLVSERRTSTLRVL
jgi:hypothetical protein